MFRVELPREDSNRFSSSEKARKSSAAPDRRVVELQTNVSLCLGTIQADEMDENTNGSEKPETAKSELYSVQTWLACCLFPLPMQEPSNQRLHPGSPTDNSGT